MYAVMPRGLPSEDGVEAVSHLPLTLLEHVSVRVRSQHDGAVAEQVLDVLEREALGEQERGSG